MFEDCYRQLVANETTAVHICYLVGVAVLERALGSVSYTNVVQLMYMMFTITNLLIQFGLL